METHCRICGGPHRNGACTESSFDSKSGQKKVETSVEVAKNLFFGKIEDKLDKLVVGTHTVDKEYDGGVGEEIFAAPTNFEEVMGQVRQTVDTAISEGWTNETLKQTLSDIRLSFDFSSLKELEDFRPLLETQELLGECVYLDELVEDLGINENETPGKEKAFEGVDTTSTAYEVAKAAALAKDLAQRARRANSGPEESVLAMIAKANEPKPSFGDRIGKFFKDLIGG